MPGLVGGFLRRVRFVIDYFFQIMTLVNPFSAKAVKGSRLNAAIISNEVWL